MIERLVPLKAVAPVRIRSGLPSTTSATRPLTWKNEGQRPGCVSGHVRLSPAVGEYLCPIRARVLVSDDGLAAVLTGVGEGHGPTTEGHPSCRSELHACDLSIVGAYPACQYRLGPALNRH